MADLNSLKQDAGTIRDASQSQENTAFRVGSWLVSLIEFLTDTTIEAVITNITPSVNADGIVLNISYQKADGSTFSKTFSIPIATTDKAGLFSPTMVAELSKLRADVNGVIQKNSNQDTAFLQLQELVDNAKNATESNGASIQTLEFKIKDYPTRISTLEGKEQFQREMNNTLLNRTGELENRLATIETVDIITMQDILNGHSDELRAIVQRIIALENK